MCVFNLLPYSWYFQRAIGFFHIFLCVRFYNAYLTFKNKIHAKKQNKNFTTIFIINNSMTRSPFQKKQKVTWPLYFFDRPILLGQGFLATTRAHSILRKIVTGGSRIFKKTKTKNKSFFFFTFKIYFLF